MKFFILSLSFIIAGYLQLSCTAKSKVLTEVGDFKITQKDVELRDQVIRVYYPQETRQLGQLQLTNAYRTAQILKNNGHKIDDEVLKRESERIDKSTLMPEMLQKIKDVFKGDQEAYLRVYILPTYAERVIFYEFFLHNAKIQAASKQAAEDFIKAATEFTSQKPVANKQVAKKSQTDFAAWVKARGLHLGKLQVSKFEGLTWDLEEKSEGGTGKSVTKGAKKGAAAAPPPDKEVPKEISDKMNEEQKQQISQEGNRWVTELIPKLKVGDIYHQVIDQKEYWLVVRYLGPSKKEKHKFEFDGVILPKEDYGKWTASEEKKVVVKGEATSPAK